MEDATLDKLDSNDQEPLDIIDHDNDLCFGFCVSSSKQFAALGPGKNC